MRAALAALAADLAAALRAAGVEPGMRRVQTFAQVLAALPPGSRDDLYWRARVTLLPGIEDLAAFDRALAGWLGNAAAALAVPVARPPAPAPPPPPARREPRPPPPSEQAASPDEAQRAPLQWVAATTEERLAERSFDAIGPGEAAAMLRLIAGVRVAAELRASRRRRAGGRGDRFDLRGTLHAAPRTGGELVRLRRTRRRLRLRPLIFLLDVSGSMEPFARALLQYARVVAVARPRVRAFAFATRLTDLTPVLRRTPAPALMAALGAELRDYGGGTRIGEALRAFNDGYAQRGIARGGTVAILSDGWERDDPALVGREMERLHRLTRRIVWVNPQKRHPAYEPLTRGMAAALPFVDVFLSGHSIRSLDDVACALEGAQRADRPKAEREGFAEGEPT